MNLPVGDGEMVFGEAEVWPSAKPGVWVTNRIGANLLLSVMALRPGDGPSRLLKAAGVGRVRYCVDYWVSVAADAAGCFKPELAS